MNTQSYVLITAARNEENNIGKTIHAVISQTVLPEKWVIVSNGSTDRTDEIINRYAAEYDFIKLLSLTQDGQRSFGAKVNAINAGYERLKNEKFAYIGNLDADVKFDSQYYEKILASFQENPQLGIAGGIILELIGDRFVGQNISLNSVSGAVQLFRRRCYEEIGGYTPVPFGGEDAIMEVLARKSGWQVQTFPELKIFHKRRIAIGKGNILTTRFRQGIRDYLLGYHPFFYAAMCLYRVIDSPYLFGSILRMCGFWWATIKRKHRPVSHDFISYLRQEQINRLRSLFSLANRAGATKTSRTASSRLSIV